MFKLLDDNVKQLTKEDAASDEDPFIKIGQSVADIIRNSGSRFSIGVYGEWGTGKTTLMRQSPVI